MKKQLEQLRDEFLEALKDVSESAGLEDLRVRYLGRKGRLSEAMKQLPDLAVDARREAGKFGNEVKQAMEAAFLDARKAVEKAQKAVRREAEWIDITAPGRVPPLGPLHITTQAIEEITDIFSKLGFVRVRHPEVEWDWYAFEALNLPKNHPARDEWETFFIRDPQKPEVMTGEKGKVVLTPHTSNGQVRELEKGNLPVRMLNIAKTYRRQSDVSHAPMFHQFEGLLVDKNVTITNLKGTIDFFVKNFFGKERESRLRPHHFRFTEPSFEIDISCEVCSGAGRTANGVCRMCTDGWLEIGGSGMVHPNVLRAGGVDPQVYSGFAFGFGVERCIMMKSGINVDDIRLLYRNDLRFLKQF